MTIYASLGVRPVINAAATLTRLGGSLMPPAVTAAMTDAAGAFVDLHELQRTVGERIADLTHNEACFVTSGAAGGIMLAIAACIAATDPEHGASFPHLGDNTRNDVIIHHSQRNGYDFAARQTGARLVEIAGQPSALEAALSERIACVLWFAGAHFADGALPIERVIEIAQRANVPVIVDAAAQIPPLASLWHFTHDLGADVAIFSGGKGLRGPQSSGLILGRRTIIEGCRALGSPQHGIGRPLKVGKEELAGILAAVEWSLAQDETQTLQRYEQIVADWIEDLAGLPGITVHRGFPSEAGQPHGRAILTVTPACPLTRDQIVDALWDSTPRIAVGTEGDQIIALNPQTIEDGEADIVVTQIRAVLGRT